MAKIIIRAAVMFIGLVSPPAWAATGLSPGQWEHQTQLITADVPGIPEFIVRMAAGHGTRRSCNSAAELASHPETLFKADDSAVCKVRRISLANGKIAFDTFCTNKHFPDGLLVSSHGTYSPTFYAISTTSTGKKSGKPVRILTTETGKRISGSCGKS